MQCGGCGTIINEGQLTCPNCGRMVWSRRSSKSTSGSDSRSGSPLPSPGDSSAQLEEIDLSESVEEVLSASPGFTPDPVQVLAQLAREPELLEEGLTLLREKDEVVGVDYATDVGHIDILARDAKGGLLVVMVAKGESSSDVVAEILQRIGWVRKRLAKSSEGVRGMVVMDRAPDNLSYAAAAVSDTVSFRTYRMMLRFEPVEI